MNIFSLHTHTIYSDGEDTAEDMILTAIDLGLSRIGITDHSFVHFDAPYCMAYEKYPAYKQELAYLKEKFKGQIEILTGIEQDFYSDYPAEGFDYVIGSVHYVKLEDEYVAIDWGGETGTKLIRDAADKYFGGDVYAVLERYFETVSNVVEKTRADIIGHFDVITKSNESHPFFDPEHPRYRAAWKKAADRLLTTGKIFEINVSPVLSGALSVPHPAPEIIDHLRKNGAKLIYTGDCHSTDRLRMFAEFMRQIDR